MTNYEKLRALADWFDGYDFSSKGFLNHNEVQQDLRAMATEFEQLQQHGVSGKQPTQFSTEAVIESIKTLWIKDFGRLDSNSPDRDGYFVCGFVHEALKAAGASGAVDTVAVRGLIKHVCGAQGYNPMLGDTCEGCESERKSSEGRG